jgi:nicotinamidase-related amidase
VLAVIDVQMGFVKPSSEHAVPAVTQLLKAWQGVGGASVIASFCNPAGSPYETISGWTRLRSPEEVALAPSLIGLAEQATMRFTKSTSNLFLAEGVLNAFRASGWTDVLLCGIDTDSCVLDTAIGAYHHGITPWLVTDACASSGGVRFHDAALELAARNLGSHLLVTSSQARSWLTPSGGAR